MRKRRVYTAEEIRFVEKKIAGRSYAETAALFNEHFGLRGKKKLTLGQMRSFLQYHKLRNGRDCRFRPGGVSHNKGKKGYCSPGSEKGWFKPGRKTWNWKPAGTERINADGYVEVRIRNPSGKPWKNWKPKHRLIWEKAHGRIPRGRAIIFADGDKSNITLGNLLMISRRELAVMNRWGLISSRRDLTETGKLIADLKLLIAERGREMKKARKTAGGKEPCGRRAARIIEYPDRKYGGKE
jgi:hypothetical protein